MYTGDFSCQTVKLCGGNIKISHTASRRYLNDNEGNKSRTITLKISIKMGLLILT